MENVSMVPGPRALAYSGRRRYPRLMKDGQEMDKRGGECGELDYTINFYTLKEACKLSDSKTGGLLDSLRLQMGVARPLLDSVDRAAELLGISVSKLRKSYEEVARRFAGLRPEDLVCRRGGPGYPDGLASVAKAPPFLFFRGQQEFVSQRIVAVVGTRRPSPQGLAEAGLVAKCLGEHAIVVASGMALGIDTAAHVAAMTNGHRTMAVLPTPLTSVYPVENAELHAELGQSQLLVSQFPPHEAIQVWHFPQRNGVMSALSEATVVVEAGPTSGALIQADYSLEQRRPVFFPQRLLALSELVWPQHYIGKPGVYTYQRPEDILAVLDSDDEKQTMWGWEQMRLF